jgi:salicylate hydroxylase
MSSAPIMIAGAGIGGLTAALALLRQGREVAVYEQAGELAEVGAGVQLSSNGTRVLNALGLASALDSCAVRPQEKEIRHWKTGQSWKLFDLGTASDARYGAPYMCSSIAPTCIAYSGRPCWRSVPMP